MLKVHQLVHILCEIDVFCNELDEYAKHKLLPGDVTKRGPDCGLSVSKIMTILIVFQMSGFRSIKGFYCEFKHLLEAIFSKATHLSTYCRINKTTHICYGFVHSN